MATFFSVKAARAAGWKDEDIQAYLAQNPTIKPDEAVTPVQKSSTLADYLPLAGGIAGGIAGGVLGPVGAIGGAGVGQALGEFGRQALSKEQIDPGKVAGEGLWGAAGGLGGEVLGAGLKLGSKALGGALTRGGEDLATRAFRPSPSQLATFEKSTGQAFPKFLQSEGLAGQGIEEIANKAKVAQDAYDSLIASGTKVSGDKYAGSLINEATKYMNADDPATKRIGESVFQLAKDIEKKYGGKMIPASELRAQRQLTDQLLSPSAFVGAPVESGTSGILRQTQKNLIDEAANTGDAGKRLQKFYNTMDIAQKGQYKGGGSLPMGITNSILTMGGLGAGGFPGAVGGFAASKLLNSAPAINVGSRLLTGAGEVAGKGIGARAMGQIGAQAGGRALFSQPITQSQGQSENNQSSGGDIQGSLPSAADIASNMGSIPGNTSTVNGDIFDALNQRLLMAMVSDFQTTGGKNLGKISQAQQILKNMQGNQKPLPVAAQTQVNLAKSGLRGLAVAQQLYQKDPSVLTKQLVPGQFASREFDSAMVRTIEALLRARSGAAVPESEVRRYMGKFGPSFGDSPQVAQFKFNQLLSDFQDVIGGANNTAGSTNELPQVPQQSYYGAQ